ncbi:MAG TPA: hypothetical protein VL335_00530 [Candidatus Paceibacterota bacterium]|jgi:hypothetical protein|nr:hypothetical protein [Candidatus Paceibacterota bacterium]
MNTQLAHVLEQFKHCWFRTIASDQFVGQIAKCHFVQNKLTINFTRIVRVAEDEEVRWRAVENDTHPDYVSHFDECKIVRISDQTIEVTSLLGDTIIFTSEPNLVETIEKLLR